MNKECSFSDGARPDNQRDMLIYGLIGLFLCIVFGFFIYYKASSAMFTQSLAELRRSADASGAEFRVRMDQMMYGMTQAASEPFIKDAIRYNDKDVLGDLMRRWKKERPYIEIWAFTDGRGRIISMLGGEPGDLPDLALNGVLSKAVRTGQAVMSVENIPLPELSIFGKDLEERINRSLPGGEKGGKSGMAQVVAVPVSDDRGGILGVIVTGIVLNGNSELVDRIYSSQNVNNAIFSGESLIAQKFEAGLNKNVGISPEALKSLYTDSQMYIGKEKLCELDHIAVYTPIKNISGQVIGARLVALRDDQYQALPGWIRNLSIMLGIFIGSIFFVVSINVRKLKALVEREKEYNHLLSNIRDFTGKIQYGISEEDICNTFINHVSKRWELSRVFIRLTDHDRDRAVTYRLPPGDGSVLENFMLEKCKPFISGRPLVFNEEGDATCSIGFVQDDSSYVCIPLIVGGRTVGVVHLESRVQYYWSEDRVCELQSYIDYLAPAISNMRLLKMLEEKAFEDQLTGAKNRRFFDEFLKQQMDISKRQGQPLSLLMMDIDLFKKFNDRYGHDAGDLVLGIFARTVKECLREADLLARYGGEEFAAVLINSDTEMARVVAERVRAAVEQLKLTRISMMDPPQITVSIGISTFPAHAEDTKELVKMADSALYAAKRAGRNRVCTPEDSRSVGYLQA